MTYRSTLLLTALILLSSATKTVDAQDLSAAEREVWAMEDAYQKFWKNLDDVDGYMELWHDKYIGWHGGYSTPINKAGVREFFRRGIIDGWTTTDYNIEGVERHGDSAVTYYSISGYRGASKNAGDAQTWRVSHYWTKESGKWQIIGGMTAPLD
jgi:Domain of unknown function (DUF4440)